MKVIGIDPGVNNGVATYEGGKLSSLETLNGWALLNFISFQCPILVAIEDSRLTSYLFTGNSDEKINDAKRIKIARNVGMVDGVCHMIESYIAAKGIEFVRQSPSDKGAKVNKRQFETITGWASSSNQHERDAAMVAYTFRFIGVR